MNEKILRMLVRMLLLEYIKNKSAVVPGSKIYWWNMRKTLEYLEEYFECVKHWYVMELVWVKLFWITMEGNVKERNIVTL